MMQYRYIQFFFGALCGVLMAFPSLASAQSAALEVSFVSGSLQVGDTFAVDILLDTNGQPTDGVDLYYLRYDPLLLSVVDADSSTPGVQIRPGTLYATTNSNSVNESAGTIDFSQITSGGETFTGSGTVATIIFKALAEGSARVTFDFMGGSTADTNVASGGADILGNVTNGLFELSSPTSSSSPQPPAPPPAPVLSFTASPNPVVVGSPLTLIWSAAGVSSCVASGGWSGTKPVSGSESVTPSAGASYSLLCSGSGGSVSQTIRVEVSSSSSDAGSSDSGGTAPSGGGSGGGGSTPSLSSASGTGSGNGAPSQQTSSSPGRATTGSAENDALIASIQAQIAALQAQIDALLKGGTSSPPPMNSSSPSSIEARFVSGAYIQTIDNLKVRSLPSLSGTQRGIQSSGRNGTIIDGPTSADGYRWWKIDYDSGPDGWSAEDWLAEADIMTPSPATSVPPSSKKFSLGDRIHTSDDLNVRSSPSLFGSLLRIQSRGRTGTIIDGPTSADGYRWWKIDYDSGPDGWSAEDWLEAGGLLPSSPIDESPAPSPSSSSASPPSAFLEISIGDRIETIDTVSVRSAPSLSAFELGVQSAGRGGKIIWGPIPADGYTWWQVDYDSGADGWSAENGLTLE